MPSPFVALIKHPILMTKSVWTITRTLFKDRREIDQGMKRYSRKNLDGNQGELFRKKLSKLTEEYYTKIKAAYPHRTMISNYSSARLAAWMELDEDAALKYWAFVQDKAE